MKKLERVIQHEVMEYLGSQPDVVVWRNSVGTATIYTEDGRPQRITYGIGTGSADLIGIIRLEVDGKPVARFFGIELKRPGLKPRPEQVNWHTAMRFYGAFVGVATSVEEARACLERARRGEFE